MNPDGLSFEDFLAGAYRDPAVRRVDSGLARIQALLADLTYKPNAEFGSHRESPGNIHVKILLHNTVSTVNGAIGPLISGTTVQDTMKDEEVVTMVRDRLIALEMHELDEWLKYRGVQVHNPHAKLPGRAMVGVY